MTEKLKAVGYVRVSTAQQADEGLSLAEQERRVTAFIEARGWEHIETFVERGVSGAVAFADRPQSARLLARLADADRVVIPKLDRIGRSTTDLIAVFDTIEKAGAAVVSLDDGIDTSTPTGKLLRTVLVGIAEFERDRLSERVSEVTEARARKGGWHGGPRPFGYEYVRDDKGKATGDGLIVVEHEAAVVRRIFGEYVAGKSQRQIARDLNADGIRPKASDEWVQGSISKLLANPVYSGAMRLKGKTYAGVHKPIVDAKTWRDAERLRLATARSDGGRGRTPKANHLLAGGLLRCGCGSAMGATTKPTRTPSVLYEVYVCSGRAQHGLGHCPQAPVRREPIDRAVFEFFAKVALDVDATRNAITEAHQAKLSELAALRDQAEHEAQQTAEAQARIERDYRADKLTAEQWTRLDAKLTSELAAAEAQTQRLQSRHQAIAADMDAIDTESAVLQELTRLRAVIVGEARDGGRAGVDAFRAALRRMFSSFDLLGGARPFGAAGGKHAQNTYGHVSDGIAWPHDDLKLGALSLLPRIREEAVLGLWDGDVEFPALRKAALALGGTDANSFVT